MISRWTEIKHPESGVWISSHRAATVRWKHSPSLVEAWRNKLQLRGRKDKDEPATRIRLTGLQARPSHDENVSRKGRRRTMRLRQSSHGRRGENGCSLGRSFVHFASSKARVSSPLELPLQTPLVRPFSSPSLFHATPLSGRCLPLLDTLRRRPIPTTRWSSVPERGREPQARRAGRRGRRLPSCLASSGLAADLSSVSLDWSCVVRTGMAHRRGLVEVEDSSQDRRA